MTFTKYRHIIWDWNGTLLDDAWLCVDIMNRVLSRRNMPPLTLRRYQEVFDFPVINYYKRLGFDFNKEPFEVSGTEFIDEYEKRRHEARLQPNAKEILKNVFNMGITQSLLSAYKQQTLEELTDQFDIRQFFIHVIGLDDHYATGKIKIGQNLMAKLKSYSGEEVLFVGDTLHDFEVAESLGIDSVLISGGHHTREKLNRSGTPVLQSLLDVLSFLHHND